MKHCRAQLELLRGCAGSGQVPAVQPVPDGSRTLLEYLCQHGVHSSVTLLAYLCHCREQGSWLEMQPAWYGCAQSLLCCGVIVIHGWRMSLNYKAPTLAWMHMDFMCDFKDIYATQPEDFWLPLLVC